MSVDLDKDLGTLMQSMGRAAREAAAVLANAPRATKDLALKVAAGQLRTQSAAILAANAQDLAAAEARGLKGALLDRLRLDPARIEAMARGLEEIVLLEDPVGTVIAQWTRPNGLLIQRVRVPLGVVGIIFESRPNVTADAGALCLKSGNAAILRPGSESACSSAAIHGCLESGLQAAGLPVACIQRIPTTDREAVRHLLAEMTEFVDVVVPRGGKGLIERVQREARVPVIGHLDGNCHVYVDRDADLPMAVKIVLNAKLRRTASADPPRHCWSTAR